MSLFPAELAAKSVQLLKRLLPAATVVGYLINPSNPQSAPVYASEASTAAKTLGIAVRVLNASTERDLDEVFASLPNAGVSGLAVPAEPFFDSERDRTSHWPRDMPFRLSTACENTRWPADS